MMDPSLARQRCLDKKIGLLVPTYNNDQSLAGVIESVSEYCSQVIVVNDGSTDSTEQILMSFPNITVVTHPINQGKGDALQSGFAQGLIMGLDYLISIDSDGQHHAYDIPRFLDHHDAHPDAIIMGARNMDQASVPGKSSYGNKVSSFWFHTETGIKLSDTQSGYRLYPIRLMAPIRFVTHRFEFEIEVLVRSAWRGIEVTEVPVDVFYPEPSLRVTHFRPFWDVTRITILNILFVFIAYAYIKPRDFFRSFKKKNQDPSLGPSFKMKQNPTD